MATVDKVVILLFSFVVSVFAGQYCTKYDSDDWFDTRTIYCSTGCCGTKYDRYCCWDDLDSNAGRIAGIVVGCIVGVGAIVTVLVIIFCCCRKGRGARGQVMRPMGGTTVTTTTVGQTAYPVSTPAYPGAYPYGQPNQTAVFTQAYPQQPAPGANWEGPKPPPYSDVQ